jgi:hypothetical protein
MRLPQKKVPRWAQTIVAEVWANQGGRYPTITWQIGGTTGGRGATYVSGHCSYWSNEITINAGAKTERWEQKMVLLHELAHAISPGGHDERFWKTAWTLYRRFNLPIRKCQGREPNRGGSRRQRLATGRGELCPNAAAPGRRSMRDVARGVTAA